MFKLPIIKKIENFQTKLEERKNSENKLKLQKKRNYIESDSLITDHDVKDYERDLQFNAESFRGKTILDIGSGWVETFSKEMEKYYNAKVFSINPKLKEQNSRQFLFGFQKIWTENNLWEGVIIPNGWQGRSIAGRGQELPIKKDSIDVILARWSISHYLEGDELVLAIKEAYETLKPGGQMLLTPINNIIRSDVFEQLKGTGMAIFRRGKQVVEITKPY
jgi:SAM-dependent methyltransferase